MHEPALIQGRRVPHARGMKALQGSWPDHVRAWRRSGETGREYCAKRGLNVHTLWSWSARMQDEKRASSKASRPGTEVRMALVRPARTIEVTATPVGSVETGVRLRVGPFTAEKVWRALQSR